MSECNKPHHTSKFWHSDGTIYCNDCDAEAVGMSLVVDAVKQLRTETPPVPQPHTEKQDDYTQSGDEMEKAIKATKKAIQDWRKDKRFHGADIVNAADYLCMLLEKSHATKGKE